LGISEDAAQKRVARALHRLRTHFTRRGVHLGATGCAAALSAQASIPIPSALPASLAAHALTTTSALGVTTLLTMTLLQKTLLAALVCTSIGVTVYQTRQVRRLENELAANHQAWLTEKDRAAAHLAGVSAELAAARETLASQARDTAAAHSEVATIAQEPEIDATVAWLERLELLKTLLHARPQATIPELQWLEHEDWLSAAMQPLKTEGDVRRAFAHLRALARIKFGLKAQVAIEKYVKAQGERVPLDSHELLPYFDLPQASEVLKNWQLVENKDAQPGQVPARWGIKSGLGPDNEMDGKYSVYSNNSTMSSGHDNIPHTIFPVLKRFIEATPNGLSRKPETLHAAELLPYAQSPAERAALEAHFGQIQHPPK
jgi:hypothetical protein